MPGTSPTDDHVFAHERQARIAELVATRGRARIGELAQMFGVTEPTVRKDLRALQERGLVKRTYGGALALHPIVDREFAGREATNQAAKKAIARACLGLLQDGDSVFLDSGTTVDAIAGRGDHRVHAGGVAAAGEDPDAEAHGKVEPTRKQLASSRNQDY